jgi:hypothetical protein
MSKLDANDRIASCAHWRLSLDIASPKQAVLVEMLASSIISCFLTPAQVEINLNSQCSR